MRWSPAADERAVAGLEQEVTGGIHDVHALASRRRP